VTYPSGKTMRDNEINQQEAARWWRRTVRLCMIQAAVTLERQT